MWQANIARKVRNGIRLDIVVHYFDDKGNEYDETLTVEGPQNDDWLNSKITDTLTKLSTLDAFEQTIVDKGVIDTTVAIDPATSVLVDASTVQPIDIQPVGKDVII